jgi:hypothetical protein
MFAAHNGVSPRPALSATSVLRTDTTTVWGHEEASAGGQYCLLNRRQLPSGEHTANTDAEQRKLSSDGAAIWVESPLKYPSAIHPQADINFPAHAFTATATLTFATSYCLTVPGVALAGENRARLIPSLTELV